MQPPFILYHKIDFPSPDVRIRGAFTAPRRFKKQIAYLKKNGFTFYTASELIKHYQDYGKFPDKAISITFDDGWQDNYIYAFPVLQHFNVKATIFLVPSCIGQTTAKVTADGEGVREHLSTYNIHHMSQYGIEFGSHSMNHKLLHQIPREEAEYEITESKKFIENLLQKQCSVFAYPAGFFTEHARNFIKECGYLGAFSTVYGAKENVDLYAINRIEILRRDRLPFSFSRKVNSIYSSNFQIP